MRNSRSLKWHSVALAISSALFLLLLLGGCSGSPAKKNSLAVAADDSIRFVAATAAAEVTPSPMPKPTPVPTPAPRGTRRYVVKAVGDIMCHEGQVEGAKNKEAGYDFYPQFELISPWLMESDLTIGNLETPLGTYEGEGSETSGFPRFNAPPHLAAGLAEAGFSAVSLANNHILDQGMKGVERTIAALDEAGIAYAGAYDSAEAAGNIRIMYLDDDMSVALLSYTQFANGGQYSLTGEQKTFALSWYDIDVIMRDIAEAREQLADVVLVMIHWGSEYDRTPSKQAIADAHAMLEAGADAVIGHHPHVLQPAEEVVIENADGTSRRGVIAYSLGNFVSAQPFDYTQTGGILNLAFDKNLDTNKTVLAEASFTITYVERARNPAGARLYRVWPAEATLADQYSGASSSLVRRISEAISQTYELFDGRLSFAE